MNTQKLGTWALAGITLLAPIAIVHPAGAQVSVQVGIALPPPIVFVAPPQVVVLPGSDIYVAADISDDIYFVDGWWWRPWQGHWYRSHAYDNGWGAYSGVPSFYGGVHANWRQDYRDHRWGGQQWNYERVPHDRVEQNWSSWKSTNYWRSGDHRPVASVPAHRGDERQPRSSPHHSADAPRSQRSSLQTAPQHSSPQRSKQSSPQHAQQQKQAAGNGAAHGQQHQQGGGKGDKQPKGHGQASSAHGGGNGKNSK